MRMRNCEKGYDIAITTPNPKPGRDIVFMYVKKDGTLDFLRGSWHCEFENLIERYKPVCENALLMYLKYK